MAGIGATFAHRKTIGRVAWPSPHVANPLALLMSAVMMLNHLAEARNDPASRQAAERVKAAYDRALADGAKTRDVGGSLGTSEFTAAVIERLS